VAILFLAFLPLQSLAFQFICIFLLSMLRTHSNYSCSIMKHSLLKFADVCEWSSRAGALLHLRGPTPCENSINQVRTAWQEVKAEVVEPLAYCDHSLLHLSLTPFPWLYAFSVFISNTVPLALATGTAFIIIH